MSDELTSDSPDGAGLDRRDLLKKAGVVGAGAVAAGALGGTAKAATKRPAGDTGSRKAAGSSGVSSRTPLTWRRSAGS